MLCTHALLGQSNGIGGGPYAGLTQVDVVPRNTALGGAGVASAYGPSAALNNPALIIDSARATKYQIEANGRFAGPSPSSHALNSNRSDLGLFSLSPQQFMVSGIQGSMAVNFLYRSYGDYTETSLDPSNEIIISDKTLIAQDLMIIYTTGIVLLDYKVGFSIRGIHQNYVDDQALIQFAGYDMGVVMNIISDFQEDSAIRLSQQMYDFLRLIRFPISDRTVEFPIVDDIDFGVVYHKTIDPINESRQVDIGISINTENELSRILIDAKTSDFAPTLLNTGIEYGFEQGFSLRGGVSYTSDSFIPSFGFGYKTSLFSIDLAYSYLSKNKSHNYAYLIDSPFRIGASLIF